MPKYSLADLPDAEEDSARVQNDKWLVIGAYSFRCVPLGQKTSDTKGDYGGWFCHVMVPTMIPQVELEKSCAYKSSCTSICFFDR